MIAVAVDAGWVNEQRESLEELEGSKRERRGTIRCGTRQAVDDWFAGPP